MRARARARVLRIVSNDKILRFTNALINYYQITPFVANGLTLSWHVMSDVQQSQSALQQNGCSENHLEKRRRKRQKKTGLNKNVLF